MTIDVPGAARTRAWGINAGQVVGPFQDAGGKWHGYLRSTDGAFTTIDVPGAFATDARDINDAEQVAGVFRDAGGKMHGYVTTQLPQQSRAQESTQRPILYFDIDTSTHEFTTGAVYPDGRRVKLLVRTAAAAWSPDGKTFAYIAEAALKLGSLNGDEKILFTPASGERLLGFLMWSPDGLKLALITLQPQQGRPFANSLVILDAVAGRVLARHEISDRTIHLPYFFSPPNKFRWSPDGRKLLISWEDVVVIDAETGHSETINSDPAIAEWAPDSSGIFYFAIKDPHKPQTRALGGLYLKRLGSGNPTKLLDEKRIQQMDLTLSPLIFGRMTLSPLGKRLAVAIGSTKSDAGVLLTYDMTVGQTTAFERPLKIFQPQGLIIALDWAPDDRSVAALAVSNQIEIGTLDLDNGEWKTLAVVAEGSHVDLDALVFGWLSWTR
jgi:Tol biopolymer transport system component